ncbi:MULTISPECIES: GntR family transcriptional regulator [Arthrobacter]|uniref:GntR family transcriptional regulator n=1 Tax=Arthrobacter terricola TaxID=2547396 RepID=A0A4R5KBW3_9MICC|nr:MULTISPECIES: GntR family transcriptional regulator [Arthrobacter]TDF92661.1 GntR family transcriptional regulator [Arthrobacter terricola]
MHIVIKSDTCDTGPMSATPTGSLRATTIAGAIAAELRAEIAAGRILPGEKLRQNELANRFGTSTTPVREAIAILRHEGLVRHTPQRGATVFSPSAEELREQYAIRTALEALAARHAAANFQAEDAAPLQALIDEMSRCVDPDRYVELNHQFHMGLYRLSKMDQLVELIDNLRGSSNAYLLISAKATAPSPQLDKEHSEILEACKAGDLQKADSAIRRHLGASARNIIEAIP